MIKNEQEYVKAFMELKEIVLSELGNDLSLDILHSVIIDGWFIALSDQMLEDEDDFSIFEHLKNNEGFDSLKRLLTKIAQTKLDQYPKLDMAIANINYEIAKGGEMVPKLKLLPFDEMLTNHERTFLGDEESLYTHCYIIVLKTDAFKAFIKNVCKKYKIKLDGSENPFKPAVMELPILNEEADEYVKDNWYDLFIQLIPEELIFMDFDKLNVDYALFKTFFEFHLDVDHIDMTEDAMDDFDEFDDSDDSDDLPF